MKGWRAFLVLQLLAGLWPNPYLLALLLPLSWLALWQAASEGRRLWPIAALLISLVLPLLVFFQRPSRFHSASPQQISVLARSLQANSHFSPAQLLSVEKALADPKIHLGDQAFDQILASLKLPPWLSFSLLNLNYDALAWKGQHFSNLYDFPSERARLVFRDGRLFAVRVLVLPSREHAVGYLALEALIASSHADEREQSWLAALAATNSRFKPVIGDLGKGELEALAAGLGAPRENFEVRMIAEPRLHPALDLLGCLWALFLFALLIRLGDRLHGREFTRFALPCAFLLFFPFEPAHPQLSIFAPHLFAGPFFAIRSPFHLLFFSALLWLSAQKILGQRELDSRLRHSFSATLFTIFLFLPSFLQDQAGFSLTHPLLAFQSAGHLLTLLGALLLFSLPLLVPASISHSKPKNALSIGFFLLLALLLAFIQPASLYTLGCLALLFRLTTLSLGWRVALILLGFYPFLAQREQQGERLIARNEILDEITLLEERAYFRMGRIVQRLDELTARIDQGEHPHLMELFARDAGLFHEDVDFALRLTGQNGRIVSEIDQHVALDHLPYALGPQNLMESYHESDSSWLIYRTSIGTANGIYELVAVIADDFHNLSLLRSLQRYRDVGDPLGIYPMAPYNAFQLDVFSRQGEPLYFPHHPEPLLEADRKALADKPFAWYVRDRTTRFLFSDKHYFYRVTHQSTPLRMLIARGIAFFLALYLLVRFIQLLQDRGYSPLERFRRSFALKMSFYIFLAGFLPTLILGMYLLKTGQSTQSREQSAIARSKILAAVQLLHPRFESTSSSEFASSDPASESWEQPQSLDSSPLHLLEFAKGFGEDLSLFQSGSLLRTSQPEAFRDGLLNRRVPYSLALDLLRHQSGYRLESRLWRERSLLTAYAALPGKNPAILAMTMIPFSQSQNLRWRERVEFGVIVWLSILFALALFARLLARNILRPVAALTRAASRMAKGLTYQPILIHRSDELQLMVTAFNTMRQRVESSQSRLGEQLEILDETLRSMSGGLIGFNRQGKIRLRNRKAWELLGLPRSPKSMQALLQQEPALLPLAELLRDGQGGEIRFTPRHRDQPIELLAKFRIVAGDHIQDLRGILALEDITGALAAGRLEAWSEMARRVAHEIKNPLTPIQLEIEHLLRLHQDQHPDFDAAIVEAAREIKRQVAHLRQTASEFSDYARPITLQAENFDLVQLLHDLLGPYQKTNPELAIVLNLPPSRTYFGDPRLLRRAFHNLVINAVQAMDGRGELRLSLKEEPDLRIELEDTGPGIPPEQRSRVFEAYFSTKDQGTGLGLVIAQKYFSLHGGAIEIADRPGPGTCFLIHLGKV